MELYEKLKISQQIFQVYVNGSDCRGGPHIDHNFTNAIHYLEEHDFQNCIITYNGYSYGLLRILIIISFLILMVEKKMVVLPVQNQQFYFLKLFKIS